MASKTIQASLADNSLSPPKNMPMILILYLLGIFMGAIDTGIVTPARTLIQAALGADERTGIWMITIYTLAYAAIIPISGKLADRYGRKLMYIISIGLFGLGSTICALSASTGMFSVMLIGRVIQAMGGGGIMPIATAEFGTTFPESKRGMALGLVGGIYGIANIIGSSAGSAILDIFGKAHWDYLFLINVPIAAAIVLLGLIFLPNTRGREVKKIDWAGIPILTVMILSLLYGLRNIDFFNLGSSILSVDVYPFLIGFAALLPILLLVEKRAADPILALEYFTNPRSLITLILSFIAGVMMMGMVFVPQFAENALRIASGSGGYFVAVLGIFAGISAPLSGGLIDRFGPKKILLAGFGISLAGALFLIFYTIPSPSWASVIVSLGIMGLGLGFTMGTPLNYMMLQNCRKEDSNSALATLSLIRSIGTAIAPAIMIGFLAHAGISAQDKLMGLLPAVKSPRLESAEKLGRQIASIQANPALAPMLGSMEIPSFAAPATMSMGGGASSGTAAMPAEMVAKLRSADVTTITDRIKDLASSMYDSRTPAVINAIQGGVRTGKGKIEAALEAMDKAAYKGRTAGMGGAPSAMPMPVASRGGLSAARTELTALVTTMAELDAEIPPAFESSKQAYLEEIEALRPKIDATFQKTLNSGFSQMYVTVAIASILAALILAFYRKGEGLGGTR